MAETVSDYHVVTNKSTLIVISILIFGVNLVDGLDNFMVNLAAPDIADALGFTVSAASWIQNSYVVGIATFLLLFAKLADRGLCKELLIGGLGIFMASSVMCAFSVTPVMMILFRFLQGVGGSMMAGVSPILVVRCFPKNMLGRGMALLALGAGLSIVLGPVIGGALADVDWKLIFYINVPIGATLILLGVWKLPKVKRHLTKIFPDVKSTVYMALFMISLLIFMEYALPNENGTSVPAAVPIIFFAIAATTIILLIRRIMSDKPNALIEKRLLTNREFRLVTLSFLLTTMIAAGVDYLLPFSLKEDWGMSSLNSGMLMTASSVAMIIMSLVAGKWCDKRGCKTPTAIAVALRIVFSVFFLLMTPVWGVIPLVICLIIAGISFGLSGTSQPTRMNHHTEPELRGEASAIMLIANYVGAAFGTISYALMISINKAIGSPMSFFQFSMILGIILGVAAMVCTMAVRNIVPENELKDE